MSVSNDSMHFGSGLHVCKGCQQHDNDSFGGKKVLSCSPIDKAKSVNLWAMRPASR